MLGSSNDEDDKGSRAPSNVIAVDRPRPSMSIAVPDSTTSTPKDGAKDKVEMQPLSAVSASTSHSSGSERGTPRANADIERDVDALVKEIDSVDSPFTSLTTIPRRSPAPSKSKSAMASPAVAYLPSPQANHRDGAIMIIEHGKDVTPIFLPGQSPETSPRLKITLPPASAILPNTVPSVSSFVSSSSSLTSASSPATSGSEVSSPGMASSLASSHPSASPTSTTTISPRKSTSPEIAATKTTNDTVTTIHLATAPPADAAAPSVEAATTTVKPSKPGHSKAVSFAVATPESEAEAGEGSGKKKAAWLPSDEGTVDVSTVRTKPNSPLTKSKKISPSNSNNTTSETVAINVDASSDTEEDDPVETTRSCCCFRLVRRAVPQRFPTDEEIVESVTKIKTARMQKQKSATRLHSSTLKPSGNSFDFNRNHTFTTQQVTPSSTAAAIVSPTNADLEAYDALLSKDFVGVQTIPGTDELQPHAFDFVEHVQKQWRGFVGCIFALLSVYRSLQLPFVSLLHVVDVALDIAVLYYWSYAGDMYDAEHRQSWFICGVIFTALPLLVQCISDVFRARPEGQESNERSQHSTTTMILIILNILHLRGFYEGFLIRRMSLHYSELYRQSLSKDPSVVVDPYAPPSAPNSMANVSTRSKIPRVRMDDESREMHSVNLTRVLFEAAPMLVLKTGALAITFAAQQDDKNAGNPNYASIIDTPDGAWLNILIISCFSSLLCLSMTCYRLISGNHEWREKGGALALSFLYTVLLLHPLHKLLTFLVLLIILPSWWTLLVAGAISVVFTGLLMVAADFASPTRRPDVSHAGGIVRAVFLLGAIEAVSSGVSLNDMISETHHVKQNLGAGAAVRWMREYWPVYFFHAAETLAVAAYYYSTNGIVWSITLPLIMAGCVCARVLALALIIPRINH